MDHFIPKANKKKVNNVENSWRLDVYKLEPTIEHTCHIQN